MLAARIDATSSPSKPGNEQLPARESERILRVGEHRGLAAALGGDRGHDQADEHPADGADALHEVAEQHPDAARAFVPPRADRRQHVRLRHDADETVDRQHRDDPRSDARWRRERETGRRQRCLHPCQTADLVPAERNQHERQDDDQKPLEQIGPRRRHQPAHEAVEDEHQRHDDDDFVDAGGGARRLADHFAGALEKPAGFDDEEADGEHDVAGAHEPARTDPRRTPPSSSGGCAGRPAP